MVLRRRDGWVVVGGCAASVVVVATSACAVNPRRRGLVHGRVVTVHGGHGVRVVRTRSRRRGVTVVLGRRWGRLMIV